MQGRHELCNGRKPSKIVKSSNKSFNLKVNKRKIVATKEMEEDKRLTNGSPYEGKNTIL
jgi:hypothetical protein